MGKQQRLQQKIDELNQQWKALSDKLYRLGQARAVETDVSQQIKLESDIKQTELERETIEQKLEKLEAQLQQYAPAELNKLLFINADATDTPLCEKICRLLKEEQLAEYVELKTAQQTPAEIREAFEAWILDCDALVVIYGNVGFGWLNQIFKNVRKIVWQRAHQPLPAYVLCAPSPEQKQRVEFNFHGISKLQYASCSDEATFREFVNSL